MLEISFVMIGLGIFFFIIGFFKWNLKRKIENTPTSLIRSISMGFVEIAGTVSKALDKPLVSPFTGKPCVYYKYSVDEHRSSGKHSHWVTISSGTQGVPFYVKDKTGSVLVNPDGAQIDVSSDVNVQTDLFRSVTPQIQSFCASRNIQLTSFFGLRKTLRFQEQHLAPADTVYVLGTACDNPNVAEGRGQHNVDDIMIHKGKHQPFYITDRPEKDILSKMNWIVYGGIFGGGVLFIGGLVFFFIFLGIF